MSMDLEEQYERIYRYCYYRLRHVQLAEDITQEVFLRYLECEHVKSGYHLAYLYTIAKNLCIDEFRKKKAENLPEDLPGDNQENEMVDSVLLRQALGELQECEREMVLLRYVNEVPIADMAKIYGISRFALYRKLRKILRELERRMCDGPAYQRGVAKIV